MQNTQTTVAVNSFVTRQTPESKFSHFEGTFEELVELVLANFASAKPGYKDGVLLVPVPADRFKSGLVEVTKETVLKSTFEARREGELPYIQTVAVGASKLPAKVVEIVLYRHDVLAENKERSTDAEWEIISINARPTEELEPLSPMAMARNMMGLPGGTKAVYTAEQFAESILYWSTRVMSGGSQ